MDNGTRDPSISIGDTLPGHVLIVEARDRKNPVESVRLVALVDLDEPYLPPLFSVADPDVEYRFRVERRENWERWGIAGARAVPGR
jgi:hypothetical protein